MIDSELQELAGRAADRPLEGLEADIWARLIRRERATYASRRLLYVQVALLVFALAGSLIVGRQLAQRRSADMLAVFFAELPLATANSHSPPP